MWKKLGRNVHNVLPKHVCIRENKILRGRQVTPHFLVTVWGIPYIYRAYMDCVLRRNKTVVNGHCAVWSSVTRALDYVDSLQWRIQDLQTGGKVERRRSEYRGAEGAEGDEMWGGVSPPHWGGVWWGGSTPSPEIFLTLDLKMSASSAFWALFFAVQLAIVQAKNTAFGLTKLAAAACVQCTAQRQQKSANTSLLESRSPLQTATLVFPRSIVCSRLSNNINILPTNFFQAANGGGHGHPAPPGSATGVLQSV